MKKTALTLICTLLLLCSLTPESHAQSSVDYLASGVAKVLGAAFAIPTEMIKDSGKVMFPFGILTGAVKGSLKTVGGVLAGGFDIARGAAPYAKYLVFL